jgi:HNH endonuclease/Helix-turn-helix domain of resolvase
MYTFNPMTDEEIYNFDKIYDRFNKYTNKSSYLPCWLWMGARLNKNRYGLLRVKNKTMLAHRLSYEIHNGTIIDKKYVLHTCDNEGCVNPEHLFLGTQLDNVKDRDFKKRGHFFNPNSHFNKIRFIPVGIKNPKSKLSEKNVHEIRKLLSEGFSNKEIAKKFSVSKDTILRIKNKSSWRHI